MPVYENITAFGGPAGTGWTGDFWAHLKEQFAGIANDLRFLIGICLEAILKIRKELATLAYYLQKWIAAWAATDIGLFSLVLTAIAAVFLVPALAAELAKLPIIVKIKAWVLTLKQGTGLLLRRLHIVELRAISSMMKILWPAYREIARTLENALGGLGEQLGLGSGALVAIFGGVRALLHSSYAILGVDSQTKEMIWFDSSTRFLEKIDEDFYSFAYDPGYLMDRVIEEMVIPASEAATDAHLSVLENAEATDRRAQEITLELENVSQHIDGIVAALPKDMTRHFMEHWLPIREGLLVSIEEFRSGVLRQFEEVLEVWREYAAVQDAINLHLMQEANDPLAVMQRADELTLQQRELLGMEMLCVVDEVYESEKPEVIPQAAASLQGPLDRMEEALRNIKTLPSLAYEPEGVIYLPAGPESSAVDWFVGEY